ncbi:hypothetical protein HK097_002024 [Rhizophlyctis rosea]|uniref:DUF676 domain-containing protein n=1 Tax=Rhizophlyctis rosea TaxID=64517 RepID=A0AAD5X487_9FUNG|nr:hypothetical protein HK097_002024 [Rhizophlyctis rosea]
MSAPTASTLSHFRKRLVSALSAAASAAPRLGFAPAIPRATAQDQLDARDRKLKQAERLAVLKDFIAGFSASNTANASTNVDPVVDSRKSHLGYRTAAVYRAPRDPIVLCHGLFGFDVLGPETMPWLQIRYWKGIVEALRDIGCKVYVSKVGSVASLRTRAHELHSYLEANGKGQRINLVAHSMGGLDCRYVISHMPAANYQVNSLTTIATPHRGSTFMDWVSESVGVGHLNDYVKRQVDDVVCGFLAKAEKKAGVSGVGTQAMDLAAPPRTPTSQPINPVIRAMFAPLDAPAFTNLTTSYCEAFNRVTPDRPDVHYASYAAVTDVSVLAPLYFPYRIIRAREGENDGLVSLTSARWGQFMGT